MTACVFDPSRFAKFRKLLKKGIAWLSDIEYPHAPKASKDARRRASAPRDGPIGDSPRKTAKPPSRSHIRRARNSCGVLGLQRISDPRPNGNGDRVHTPRAIWRGPTLSACALSGGVGVRAHENRRGNRRASVAGSSSQVGSRAIGAISFNAAQ